MRSHSATLDACCLNSFWYLDRSVAQRVMISSIVLFLSRGSWDGGPAVEAPNADVLAPAAPGPAWPVGAAPAVDAPSPAPARLGNFNASVAGADVVAPG